MTPEEIKQAWFLVRKYGSGNCWAGTAGGIAAALARALREIERLKEEQAK